MDIWIIIVWAVLAALTLKDYRLIPDRIAAIRIGARGIFLVPVALAILFPMLFCAWYLAQIFPFLQWGWLNMNIVAAPIADIGDNVAKGGDLTPFLYLELFVTVVLIAIMCLLCNYYEETDFRSSYKMVVVWAFLHLIMGIPIWAVIPIFSVGLCYKVIHDRWSVNHSYCTHFFTNMVIIMIATISIILVGAS